MNYALVAVILVQCLCLLYMVDKLTRRAREEREALEDRLMALTNMDSLIIHKAHENPTPGEVSYVDEGREWELSPGGGGNADYEDDS
jgi:hypothetical protein